MAEPDVLLKPEECVMLLVDFQAGLGFGVESTPRQVVVNNAVALARTAVAFKVSVVASTSASRVYSGPLLPARGTPDGKGYRTKEYDRMGGRAGQKRSTFRSSKTINCGRIPH
jgi:nicotinamidase-related amidase